MPVHRLTSLDDSRLSAYHQLKGRGPSDESFIVEGWWLTERLLDSRFETLSILVEEKVADRASSLVDDTIDLFVVDNESLAGVVGYQFHRGVLAHARTPRRRSLTESLAGLSGESLRVVVCLNISDQENMGGILRNCAAFGVDLVLHGPTGVNPYTRRIGRTSMGALFQLPMGWLDDPVSNLQTLRTEYSLQTIGTVLDPSAESLKDLPELPRFALVVGNEGFGLTDAVSEACSRRVRIPMAPGTDSLNVATASAIFLYSFSSLS